MKKELAPAKLHQGDPVAHKKLIFGPLTPQDAQSPPPDAPNPPSRTLRQTGLDRPRPPEPPKASPNLSNILPKLVL